MAEAQWPRLSGRSLVLHLHLTNVRLALHLALLPSDGRGVEQRTDVLPVLDDEIRLVILVEMEFLSVVGLFLIEGDVDDVLVIVCVVLLLQSALPLVFEVLADGYDVS